MWENRRGLAKNNRKTAGKARSGGETVGMGQEAASGGSFGITDISSSDGGEERAGSETSLYYFGGYRWTTALTECEWPSSACKEGVQSFSTMGGRSIHPGNASENRRLTVLASGLKRSADS